jgi:hypothetical protein
MTDLITARANRRQGAVTALLNDGAGHFQTRRVHPFGATALGAGDLNSDGLIDLVTASPWHGGLTVLLGTGSGNFAPARQLGGKYAYSLALGDLNRDGKLDVALINDDGRDHVIMRLGNGDGTFGPELPSERAGQNVVGVTLADLNHDGVLDIASADFDGRYGVSIFLGRGDGSFGPRTVLGKVYEPDAVLVADFDADGNVDLAISSVDDVPAIRRGRGDGTFEKPLYIPWPLAVSGAVADFNRDGRPDIAFLHGEGGSWVKVYLNWTGLPAPPCVVFDVIHDPVRAAKRYIDDSGCRLGKLRYRYSRKVRKGRVISQRPAGEGTVLPSGSPIDILVSRGKPPRPR